MIATDDGGLLLCNYSEQQGVVVVYGENGNYMKLKSLPLILPSQFSGC